MDRKKAILVMLFSTFSIIFFIGYTTGLVLLFYYFSEFWYWMFLFNVFIFYGIQLFTGFKILNSIRSANVKMCWIFVLYSIPYFGLFIFLIFGIIPLKMKNQQDILKQKEEFNKCEDYSFSEKYFKEKDLDIDFHFAYNFDKSPLYENNDFKIIDQKDLFEQIIKTIEKANEFIHIQYYIISNSFFFNGLKKLLIEKAKQNVKIRFLYDYAGSYKRIKSKYLRELKKNNIEVEIFNPKNFNKYTSNSNFRSHKKLIIVDNKYCISGGSNIGDEYINMRKKYNNWIDMNYLIEGEIVNNINLNFCYDWLYYSSNMKKKNRDLNFYKNYKIYRNSKSKNIMQLINSGPDSKINIFSSLLISKIAKSKKSIIIATPYVLLQEQIIQQLIFAAIRGVKIQFILPNLPDNKKYILTLNRSNYKYFLENKIEIYEYLGFMHSKFILIDDDISILGSNNLDFRSIILNYELAFLINSKKINNEIKNIYNEYLKNSIKYNIELVRKEYNAIDKFKMRFINIIHPLL